MKRGRASGEGKEIANPLGVCLSLPDRPFARIERKQKYAVPKHDWDDLVSYGQPNQLRRLQKSHDGTFGTLFDGDSARHAPNTFHVQILTCLCE